MAVHLVVVPVTWVFSTLFIEKSAIAITNCIFQGALINTFRKLDSDNVLMDAWAIEFSLVKGEQFILSAFK